MDNTAKEICSSININNLPYDVNKDIYAPEFNIYVGTAYVKKLMKKYNNNYPLMLAAYNAGMGNVDKWINTGVIDITKDNFYESIPFGETKEYVIKGIRSRNMYDRLY